MDPDNSLKTVIDTVERTVRGLRKIAGEDFGELVKESLHGEKPISNKDLRKLMFLSLRLEGRVFGLNIGNISAAARKTLPGHQLFRWYSVLNQKGYHQVVFNELEWLPSLREDIVLPETLVVSWAKKALNVPISYGREYRWGGMILLQTGYWQSELITFAELYQWTESAAKKDYDHGITRIFSILVNRLNKKYGRRLPRRAAVPLAVSLSGVFEREDAFDHRFLPEIFFKGLRELFSPKTYRMVTEMFLEAAGKRIRRGEKDRKKIIRDLSKMRRRIELSEPPA